MAGRIGCGLGGTIVEIAEHPVPRSSASWWYVFGSATFVVFILQFVTGICLATVYTPAADRAWQSLIYLNYDQPLGWYLRALHGWGSNFMVGPDVHPHGQVFLFGAYKYPRELTWVAGVRAAAVHAGDGVHRTGAALRSERVLGPRNRRLDRWPHSDHRRQGRRSDPGRSDNRRRNAVAILHAARLRDSRRC